MKVNFFMPTKIFLGKDCIAEQAAQFKQLGRKAFIATGKSSAKNGSLDAVTAALTACQIPFVLFDQIASNPSIDLVRKAAEVAREAQVDFVIGIGGGSPMDAAKAIAVLVSNEVDDQVLFSGPYENAVLPIVAVPTTAGTGSEVTQYSILTNDQAQSKTSIANEVIFPRIAFLDASYTADLPKQVTIHTAIDALSHAVEGYLSVKATAASRLLATESMSLIGKCLTSLTKEIDFSVREQLLYASMLGGMVIAHTGTTALHALGYSLTYFRHIDHGRANGLLMYEYLTYVAVAHEEKVAEVIALLGLETMDQLRDCLNLLLGQKEAISAKEVSLFSLKASEAKNIGNTLTTPSHEELAGILERSLG